LEGHQASFFKLIGEWEKAGFYHAQKSASRVATSRYS
jgi:hypothetical protein